VILWSNQGTKSRFDNERNKGVKKNVTTGRNCTIDAVQMALASAKAVPNDVSMIDHHRQFTVKKKSSQQT
jgi:hypothetical protein